MAGQQALKAAIWPDPIGPLRVRMALQRRQDAIPDPSSLPAIVAGRDGLPRAIALGQGAPGTTGAQDPQDAVENDAVVPGGASGAGFLRRESLTKPLPLPLTQTIRCHSANGRAL